jgi:hypothetical protein
MKGRQNEQSFFLDKPSKFVGRVAVGSLAWLAAGLTWLAALVVVAGPIGLLQSLKGRAAPRPGGVCR